jgi:hypothetical protein
MDLKVYCQNIKDIQLQSTASDVDVYYGIADSFVTRVPVLINSLSDNEKVKANRFK